MKKLLLALSCITTMFSQTFTTMVIPLRDITKNNYFNQILNNSKKTSKVCYYG